MKSTNEHIELSKETTRPYPDIYMELLEHLMEESRREMYQENNHHIKEKCI